MLGLALILSSDDLSISKMVSMFPANTSNWKLWPFLLVLRVKKEAKRCGTGKHVGQRERSCCHTAWL